MVWNVDSSAAAAIFSARLVNLLDNFLDFPSFATTRLFSLLSLCNRRDLPLKAWHAFLQLRAAAAAAILGL